MPILANVVYWAALLTFYVLWARVILDFVRQLRRDWKPKGFMLAVSVAILRVTDPLLRLGRRVFRPIKVGGGRVDIAMLGLMITLFIIMSIASLLAR